MLIKIAFAAALVAVAGATWNTDPARSVVWGPERGREAVEPDAGVDAFTSKMFLDSLLTIVRLRPGR